MTALLRSDDTFKGLRRFNLFAAALHAVQGVVMLVVSSDFTLPVTSSFVELDAATGKLAPVLHESLLLRVGPLVALFLFLSALAHIAVSLPGIHEWYVAHLKKGANNARWIEYSFSASLMLVVIAMLAGMYDGISLLLLFALGAVMNLFGWMMELHNQTTKKTNWTAFLFGSKAGLLAWVVIALALFNAGSGDAKPPMFVYWIFFSIFLVFNCFAINMVLQYKKVGRWKDYLYGERVYIVLSLVAKSLLAWQVWAGTLRPV